MQSATGQTALLTGVNTAKLLGRHLNALPNQKLRQVLAAESILKKLTQRQYSVAFINTFSPPFFDHNPHDIIRYLSATSVSNLFAGLPFFNLDDLKAERSIYQEFTNSHLREKGFDVPLFTPEKAGEILARQSNNYDFCLYEYFQTDKAGHSREMEFATLEIKKLEHFITSVLQHVNLAHTMVILVSDHGNIEDISVKGHTRNPAMTLLWGYKSKEIAQKLHTITDVTPVLLSWFYTE